MTAITEGDQSYGAMNRDSKTVVEANGLPKTGADPGGVDRVASHPPNLSLLFNCMYILLKKNSKSMMMNIPFMH